MNASPHLPVRLAVSAAAVAAVLLVAGCGETAKLAPELTTGPRPQLADPNKTLIPTVNVAPAVGWADTAGPTPPEGLGATDVAWLQQAAEVYRRLELVRNAIDMRQVVATDLLPGK